MKKKIISLLFAVGICYSTPPIDTSGWPSSVNTVVAAWVADNRGLVDRLLARGVSLADYAQAQRENKQFLQDAGIHDYGRYNYIFELTELPGYILKISCLTCRLANIIVANGYWPRLFYDESEEVQQQLYSEFKPVLTYQTVSYWNTYRLYEELSKTMVLSYVRLPRTFVFVPYVNEPVSDQNCIIVQEKIDLVDEKSECELLKILSEPQLKELITVIGTCGLWNLHSNIKFDRDGHLVIVSLEQPNVSNPLNGFNQHDLFQFMNNVQAGIDELYALFDADGTRQTWISNYADSLLDSLQMRLNAA